MKCVAWPSSSRVALQGRPSHWHHLGRGPCIHAQALEKKNEITQEEGGLSISRAPDLQESGEPTTSAPAAFQEPGVEKQLPYGAVTGIAALGMAETAYLTLTKLFGSAPVCPVSGCETVLSSSYSELFGVPLSLLGFLAYAAVTALAATAQKQTPQNKATYNTALMSGACLLSGVSAMLLYILQTRFSGEPCVWCYGSAGLSFTLLGLVSMSLPSRQLAAAAGPGLGSLATAALVLYLGFARVEPSTAGEDFELPYSPPVVTEASSSQAVTLARKLKSAGARMYGAFWCSHCFDQKQVFGKEAMADFPYVECYPDGWKKGTKVIDACEAAGVRAFPTWVINGKVVEGQLTLEALEAELATSSSVTPQRAPSPFAEQ